MSDELFLREIPDWTAALRRTETPLMKLIDPLPEIGGQDRHGRTLLGFTTVDEAAKQAVFDEWSVQYRRYEALIAELVFCLADDPEHAGYYEPCHTDESRALEHEVDALWYQYCRFQPEPIWDRELPATAKMEWGMR